MMPSRMSGPVVGGLGTALVVEDDDDVRTLLTEILSQAGFRCLEAPSAEHALALLEHERPSLAVLDIRLPEMSGAELGWRIRESMPEIPLVAVSAHLSAWDRDDLLDLGFDCVFGKPLDREQFIRHCRGLCA